jgi:hypothetical protein
MSNPSIDKNFRSTTFWLPPALMAACVALVLSGCPGGGGGDKCAAGLLAGDLVITEIMANPAGQDDGKEWFEIYNPSSSATIDLTGVLVEAARADGSGGSTHVVAGADIGPGQYLVLGGMLAEVKPDYVDYAYGADLGGLRNAGGQISLRCGQALIDKVIYTDTTEGVSRGLDGSKTPDSILNDTLENWCDSKVEFAADSFGTPGAANEACEGDLPPTSCKENGQVRDVVAPVVSDLVITEFMPNPAAVSDTLGEWFEVYLARDIDLNGLQLGKTAGTWDEQISSLDCIPAKAGSYLLFARSSDTLQNGGLPAVDRVFGLTLANSGGSLMIGYGGQVIDAISYSSSHTGASSALEPTLTDPLENDNQDYWCAGSDAYGNGDLGSPGAANPSCGITPAGKCREGDSLRDQRLPVAGDLVITEIMADPDAAADAVGEWFEMYVGADVDLNRLQLGKTPPTVNFSLPGGDCLPVTAGSYVVFAASTDSATNGGLPRADFLLDFGLTNAGGSIFVGFDDVVFDQVQYGAAAAGKATSLDPGSRDTTANDDLGNWCPAVSGYGDGDLGTPGTDNPVCQ